MSTTGVAIRAGANENGIARSGHGQIPLPSSPGTKHPPAGADFQHRGASAAGLCA